MRQRQVFLVAAALMALAVPIHAATTFTATGTWTEVFGPAGEGSAGGTLSATMSGSGWTVALPQAIHQGVSGNPGPGIYITNYVVNPATPAQIVNSNGCTALSFKILTLTVTADQNTASFTMTGSATSDLGPVGLVLSGSGTVTAKSGSNPGDTQSGPISAQITLTFSWPMAETKAATAVTETKAVLNGIVVRDGGLCCDTRFAYWADGGKPVYTDWKGSVKQGFPLSAEVKGLTPGTLYYFRVEIKNAEGNYTHNKLSFVTTARIAISSTDGGSVVVPGEGTFLKPVGTVMAVEAQKDAGWAFVGWTGSAVDAGLVADATAAATTVVLKGDTTLKANFKIKVIWVSFHGTEAATANAATAGFTEAPDKGYTDLLKGADYEVVRYVQTGTPDVNVLNTAALVIISRSVASGSFQNAAATTWNTQVTAPMINTGAYTLRKNRTGFYTGNTIPDTTDVVKLTAVVPNHPIFKGIALTDGAMDANFAGITIYPDGVTVARGISVVTDPVDANGIILATISDASAAAGPAGAMMIAEWPVGAVLKHDGGGLADTLAGRRMVFLTGSREASGKNSEGTGMIDLTDDGKQLFLNAVKYMVTQPVEVPVVNPSFEDPNAGKIKGWNGEGVGGTPAVDIPGWASDAAPADSGVEQGWGATDGIWTGFLMSGDPMVYQLTGYEIQAGDIFLMKVDAKNNWAATKFMMILYYDDMALPVPVATQEVDLTDAMQNFSMWFAADTIPDCVGKKLGIELANSSPGESWMGMDNVRLSVYSMK